VRSLCIRVPKQQGESARKKLLDGHLLDVGLKIRRTEQGVLLPIVDERARELGFELCEEEFEERPLPETDYRNLVELPPDLKELLPTSFDIIGDVAIIKLPEELERSRHEIGAALRKAFPRLRTVARDRGVKGETRVRDLEVVAGDEDTETTHTEYGVRFLVDPAKAYFNPRLANERKRVASLVKEGEVVVDMFAGVGPFSIMIAKLAKPAAVYAIDINPDSISYLRKNIELNRAQRVIPIEGDARQVLYGLPNPDRVVMNLPHSAIDFFHDALTRLNVGGTIHFYHICDRESIDTIMDTLVTQAKGAGVKVEVDRLEELKTYSPSMSVYSADVRLLDWV
jgi:tRNA (guanine37-N1)-methyltransferase